MPGENSTENTDPSRCEESRLDRIGTHEVVGPARLGQLVAHDRRAIEPFLDGTDTPSAAATAIEALARVIPDEGPVPLLPTVVETVRGHDHPPVNEAAVPYLSAASRVVPATLAAHAAVFERMLATGFTPGADVDYPLRDWRAVQQVTATLAALIETHPDAVLPAGTELLAFVACHLGQGSLRRQVLETLADAVVPDDPFGSVQLGESPRFGAVEPTGRAYRLAPAVPDLVRIVDRHNGYRGEWELLYAIALERPGAVAPHLDTVATGWHGRSVGSEHWLFVSGILSLVAEGRNRPHPEPVVDAAGRTLERAATGLATTDHPIEYPADRDALRTLWCLPVVLAVLVDHARARPLATADAVGEAPLRERIRTLGTELWAAVPPLVEAATATSPAAVVPLQLLEAIAAATGAFVTRHTGTLRTIRADADHERVRAAAARVLATLETE
jgi:hypothetical protein